MVSTRRRKKVISLIIGVNIIIGMTAGLVQDSVSKKPGDLVALSISFQFHSQSRSHRGKRSRP